MQYYNSIDNFKFTIPSAVTLGKFDGVHKGHQKLIKKLKKIAAERNLRPVMFTFEFFKPEKSQARDYRFIFTKEEKRSLAHKFGIEAFIECPFSDSLRNTRANDFIKDILVKRLRTAAIVAGCDFKFGKNREGDAEYLKKNAECFGLEVDIIEKEKYEGRDISSTYIREELASGNIEKVNSLLGFEYFITGEVVEGAHMGRTLGFPTINIVPEDTKLLPLNGVYQSRTDINNRTYESISDIGVGPTFDGVKMKVETFIFNLNKDLYGKTASVKLLNFIRPEIKFSSAEELERQINLDIQMRRIKK